MTVEVGQVHYGAAAVQQLPVGSVIAWPAVPEDGYDEVVATVERWGELDEPLMLSHSAASYWLSHPADLIGDRSFTVLRVGRG